MRRLVAELNPAIPSDQIQHGPLESLPWEDGSVDAVISSAVLHFARDEEQFSAMVRELWRVLAPSRANASSSTCAGPHCSVTARAPAWR